jgi:hypothetical protein
MSLASDAARVEAARWVAVVNTLEVVPREADVTGVDPGIELARRGDRWSYRFATGDLAEVCLFAAGLAVAEADAWDDDDPIIATRAHEDRRFVAGDRVVWWAVPWALEANPTVAGMLLEFGESLRVAPALVGTEGLVVPGHDTLGPIDPDRPLDQWLATVLSGAVLHGRPPTVDIYRTAESMWKEMTMQWPGTAQIWIDLAARAARTAAVLAPTS